MKNDLILLFVIAISGVKCLVYLKAQNITNRSASAKKPLENTEPENKVQDFSKLAIPIGNSSKSMLEQNAIRNNNEKTLRVIESIKSSQDPTNTYQRATHANKLNIADYRIAFYGFIGLSFAAIMFFACKSYRLRLSRAERKYGVQGDRNAQELTPLPVALDYSNSDDEDQTIFDISRQQIVL